MKKIRLLELHNFKEDVNRRIFYVPNKNACDMIAKEDFPVVIETLKVTFELIFNY